MVEMAFSDNELKNVFEHDDLAKSPDLYAKTVPEKTGKGFLSRIQKVLSPKNKEGISPYGEAAFEDPVFEENPGGRCAALSFILGNRMKGKSFNAPRYFDFLKQAFQGNEMVFPEGDARLYFLVMGDVENVLTPEESMDLSEMHPEYREFFADKASWKLDGRIVSEGTPGAEQRGWTVADAKVWKTVINPTSENGFFQGVVSSGLKKFNEEFIQKSEELKARKERNKTLNLDQEVGNVSNKVGGVLGNQEESKEPRYSLAA